jgi:hypothetical protein
MANLTGLVRCARLFGFDCIASCIRWQRQGEEGRTNRGTAVSWPASIRARRRNSSSSRGAASTARTEAADVKVLISDAGLHPYLAQLVCAPGRRCRLS